MSLVYRILYAAHASGTHHKLALRSLAALGGPDAERWRALMLSHAGRYLDGAKAPDKTFKDFQNHVLHVGDGDWGGAPAAARRWYEQAVAALQERAWGEAAYALGVLSHYYTDPLMPFHTDSSDAETKLHRAVEWSIAQSAEDLFSFARPVKVLMGGGDDWLELMVRDGALASHAHYQTLIDHYEFDAGVDDPASGLDDVARAALAPLLAHGVHGFARVMRRAFDASEMAPPSVSLSVATVIAALKIPVKWVQRKLADAADQAEVARIHEELARTGKLEAALPAEQRVVRERVAAHRRRREKEAEILRERVASRPPTAAGEDKRAGRKGPRLRREDPVEDAPSIGPKTAERLEAVDIRTVGDLLEAEPARLAEALGDTRLTEQEIGRWRSQALLLTQLADLKPAHAVMLVAAGYRDPARISRADSARLAEELARIAETSEIQRATWKATPPDEPRVAAIIASARALIGEETPASEPVLADA